MERMINYKLYFEKKILYKYIIVLIYLIYLIKIIYNKKKLKKIGIIGLPHSQNIGNNLLKYAIYIKVCELGFDPYIVGQRYGKENISFILDKAKVRLINKTFKEIGENDFDILMVNSDQTWRRHCDRFFYDIAFLNFSKKWSIPKFVYGASLGMDYWEYTKQEEEIAKSLLFKNFKFI